MESIPRLVLEPEQRETMASSDGEVGPAFHSGAFPENLAYVIYTSGSTGRPKGVQVTRGALDNFLLAMMESPGLGPDDILLAVTTLSFDIAGLELYLPLLVGARVVIARAEEAGDAVRLKALLARSGATVMQATPATWRMLLEAGWEPERPLRILCGGEALPRDLAGRLLERAESLWNLYGPTETTVWSCAGRVAPAEGPLPIGRPIRNTGIRILDEKGNPAPVGVAGELCITGAGLARGYLGRPALTAEKLVPCAFGGQPGERLYRTGDLARYHPDGTIDFLGRIDHQIKVRGFRIEPGEIEAALVRHPGVRAAVAVAREEDGGEKRLVAYYTAGPAAPPAAGELREHLAGLLPAYMVPSAFVRLDALPLTPNGKIDRKALPAPGPARPELDSAYAAPRGELDRRLVELWQEVLGVEPVGIHDDFFELGGDSIRGAMLVNRLQQELGETLYVMALFEVPTVERYADHLRTTYGRSVARRFPGEAVLADAEAVEEVRPVGPAELGEMEGFLAARRPRSAPRPRASRNRPALFILSPPRSGSTLLRVMLAGHPRLFSPPELNLVGWETVEERNLALSGHDSFSSEGLVRAVMEAEGCDAAAAVERLRAAETPGASTADLYRFLQERIGGRLLVDKTPTYALDLETLRRAERFFDGACYIHLTRHPRSSIRSYVEARLDQVYRLPFEARRQAELVWLVCHGNILRFLEEVPRERQRLLRFEDLVRDPRRAMEDVCSMLGLDFEPAMLRPYEGKRMTDGVHAASRMMGDPRFHEHRDIESSAAEKWVDDEGLDMGSLTWSRAEALGYARPAAAALDGPRPVPRDRTLPLSFAQERLWLLDRLLPGSAAYNVHIPLRLAGGLDPAALREALTELLRRHEVLRAAFPEAGGHPVQEIADPAPAALPLIDLAGCPGAGEEARRLAEGEARRPFDLAAGPLLRATLVRLEPREHRLLLTVHHLACDGWSRGLLVRELGALYQAFAAGLPPSLPEPPIQYADFAVWQRASLTGEVLDEQIRFWKERLAAPSVLDLPTDRSRPAVPSFRGAERRLRLAPGLGAALRSLGRQRRATAFMVLLAAYKALLFRLSGNADLIVGTPVAGRNRAEIEGAIGFFANTLALRTGLGGNPSFAEVVDRVRDTALAALAHQDVPFERLIEELHLERDLSRNPLFQVDFVLLSFPVPEVRLPGLDLLPLEVAHGTAKFDLTLSILEGEAGLLAGLEYSADLFEEATAARLLERFGTLLEEASADPGRSIGELPVLSPGESHQVLAEWGGTAAPEAEDACLHHLFEKRADRAPEAVAVERDSRRLTYRELEEQANRLARHLRWLGVRPEEPVGVCLERGPEAVVALLAILKAGGVYLPLDPASPAQRITACVQGSGARVVIADAGLLPEGAAPAVLHPDAARSGMEPGRLHPASLPSGLAYLIYTSGSTGEPKAVGVPHAAAARHCRAVSREYGLGPDDRVLQFASLSFDVSLEQILPALAAGSTLVLRGGELPPPASFSAWLAERRITVADLPTAYLSQWVKEGEAVPGGTRLRLVSAGGEAMPEEAARLWLERSARLGAAGVPLLNAYGPTEAVITATLHRVDSLPRGAAAAIGRPLAGRTARVLDPWGQPAPVGVPGELHLGGLLARGYLDAPDLTAGRFVPDPWSGLPGDRLYRTGDLVRWLPGGGLEFLGRLDDQVKLRGFRIEPGEIAAVLREHPAVRQAEVLPHGDGPDGRRLVAWVAVGGGTAPRPEELRAFVEARLPSYMVPAAVAVLDSLPLTAAGKVDRRALRELVPEVQREAGGVAPRNPLEEVVAGVWSELLGVERVGVEESFFSLGGHSLKAMQMVARLSRIFCVELPARVVFEAPTVAALCRRLAADPAARERVEKAARLWLRLSGAAEGGAAKTMETQEVRA